MLKFKTGLKIWSTNSDMISEAQGVYDDGHFDYIELYVVPGTYALTIKKWSSFKVEYIIHCPHSGCGFNLADSKLREENRLKFKEAQDFANTLKADYIIVHLGNNGYLNESIFQLKGIFDERICIENKPIEGLNGEECIGCTPEDIKKVLKETHAKSLAMDFGHAIYAANKLNVNSCDFIENLLTLNPKIFHLSDGQINLTKDYHSNFGEGNFNLAKLISYIPKNAHVTLEIPQDFNNGLMDFKRNLQYIMQFIVTK